MKILIISLPRTGSNSLMKKYANQHNLIMIGEPFNEKNKNIDFEWENMNNIIVKTIVNQKPNHIKEDTIEFYLDFSKKFDQIILLNRRDKKDCAESLAFLNYNEKNGFKFDKKYEWYETPNIEISKKFLEECDEQLTELSKLLMIDIIYYEDIFDINSKDKLRIGNYKAKDLI
jgi:hypothetical protein